eukprot:2919137-Rhodomonas_salina.1
MGCLDRVSRPSPMGGSSILILVSWFSLRDYFSPVSCPSPMGCSSSRSTLKGVASIQRLCSG